MKLIFEPKMRDTCHFYFSTSENRRKFCFKMLEPKFTHFYCNHFETVKQNPKTYSLFGYLKHGFISGSQCIAKVIFNRYTWKWKIIQTSSWKMKIFPQNILEKIIPQNILPTSKICFCESTPSASKWWYFSCFKSKSGKSL